MKSQILIAALVAFSMSAFAQDSSAPVPAAPSTPVAADQKVQQDRKELKEAKKDVKSAKKNVRKAKRQLRKDKRARHEEKKEDKVQ